MKHSIIDIPVADARSGDWAVESFEMSERQSRFTKLRASLGHTLEYCPPGKYKRLVRGRTIVMSNTPMELLTNQPIIRAAKGRVLINGLGLGMVLVAILKKKSVKEVRVIEKSEDVIKIVGPAFTADPRVQIIQGDAFKYDLNPGESFDCVWHDIWDAICGDNLAEMKKLEARYAGRCFWQDSWGKRECLRARFF